MLVLQLCPSQQSWTCTRLDKPHFSLIARWKWGAGRLTLCRAPSYRVAVDLEHMPFENCIKNSFLVKLNINNTPSCQIPALLGFRQKHAWRTNLELLRARPSLQKVPSCVRPIPEFFPVSNLNLLSPAQEKRLKDSQQRSKICQEHVILCGKFRETQ